MGKTILVVDDNDSLRNRIVQTLQQTAKYELVLGADTAEKMFDMLRKFHVDLLILELLLPDADGIDVLKRIQELGYDTKILALTHFKTDDFVARLVELDVSYILLKPVNEKILEHRVADIMKSYAPTGNISIDTERTRASRTSPRLIDEKLSNIFISVGIPAHIKGYQFLREAIKMTIDEPGMINSITKRLYPAVADVYETSASKVERAIRHAIEVAWNRGKIENINAVFGVKVYGSNDKPTNGEFIALVADKMLIEGA